MSNVRTTLLADASKPLDVVKHTLNGTTYTFKLPMLEAHQRVLAAGGVTALPGAKKKGAKEEKRFMFLGKMKAQALIETLLDENGLHVFTDADMAELLKASVKALTSRLGDFALELFDVDDGDEEAPTGNG